MPAPSADPEARVTDASPSVPILECLPNVSSADPGILRQLAATLASPPQVRLVHASTDRRHERTVFTVIGEDGPLQDALVALARRAVELIDLSTHDGLHPRVGVLDVVPLVALAPHRPPVELAETARALAGRIAEEAGLTCVVFDAADPDDRSLPELRRGGPARLFRRIDAGEVPAFHPARGDGRTRRRRGITCVGARGPLVSLNVELGTGEHRLARRVASRVHEKNGGLPSLRALALKLSEESSQVCLSLLDPCRTGVEAAFDLVERLAAEEGVAVLRSELVGCVRRAAWPPGLGVLVREPEVRDREEERRVLEAWLPGGPFAEDEGLRPLDLPVPGRPPAAQSGRARMREPGAPRLRLLDLPLAEAQQRLASLVEELGERPYRASQVTGAVWRQRARSFEAMAELPRALRERLAERVELALLEPCERAASADGTVKYLWRLPDGDEVESVAIPSARRTTFCLSSQVGCSLECRFCATGYLRFQRNLSPGEMVDQALAMLADQELSSESLNIVFMGQGEPGHNLRSVLRAVRVLNDPSGLGVGARRITVSTSGVVPAILELGEQPVQCRLAVSLHAVDQDLRESLMNVARKYPIDELLAACRSYHAATRRRITFEYCVIPGVNDGAEQARGLARFASAVPSKVNLIPYNPVAEYQPEAATREDVERFRERVRATFAGEVVVRETRGRDVEAACGMLHGRRLRARAEAAGGETGREA